MIRNRVYLIKCARMKRSERLFIRELRELHGYIDQYIHLYGDLEFLFLEE